jgi:hypothetical protein
MSLQNAATSLAVSSVHGDAELSGAGVVAVPPTMSSAAKTCPMIIAPSRVGGSIRVANDGRHAAARTGALGSPAVTDERRHRLC